MAKQVVRMGDKVYCPYCQDSYWVDDRVEMWRVSPGSPQMEVRCATCGRTFGFELMAPSQETKGSISPTEAADLLAKIYEKHPEGLHPNAPDRAKVREIGQALYDAGGMSYMLSAHQEFANRNPRHARNLEMVWDGIGEWMG